MSPQKSQRVKPRSRHMQMVCYAVEHVRQNRA